MSRLMLLLVVAILPCFATSTRGFYKSLQGPPSSFGRHRVPDPSKTVLESFSAMLPLAVAGPAFKTSFPVDSEHKAAVIFFSPLLSEYAITLAFPNGTQVAQQPVEASFPVSDSGPAAPGIAWEFATPVRGNWSVLLAQKHAPVHKQQKEPVHGVMPNAFLMVQNDGEELIASHLASYSLERDQLVGVVSRIARAREGRRRAARGVKITRAELDIITPDSRRLVVPMLDNGLMDDGVAGDGTYGGKFNASVSGLYKATAVLAGVLADGSPFARSTSHVMQVVHDNVELAAGAAQLIVAQDHLLQLRIPVTGDSAPGTVYRVYAEVHADLVPVAWAGGMAAKQCAGSVCFLEVELHAQWLRDAGADVNLFAIALQHVTVYDKNSNVPISQRLHMRVHQQRPAALAALVASLPLREKDAEATEEMLMGRRPLHLQMQRSRNESLPSLVLVHGWCAQIQPWAGEGAFTNSVLFEDLNQNRPTAQFAELLAERTAQLPSFGLVGHSQGGLASVHLHNYIWSGLEAAVGERKIQTIGTPYHGSSGAGSSADTIKIFGYGCGASFDLSVDGAALWESGIQTEARKDVFFYRTQWAESGLLKYCNLACNAVLKWPNDGMAENEYGVLEGGHDMGLFKGECHTLNMRYPPQYRSNPRNTEMNAKAAR